MKKTVDGNNYKPIMRNQDPQVKRPVNHTVNSANAPKKKTTVQRPVQGRPQGPSGSSVQRPVQRSSQAPNKRPVQKQAQRPVNSTQRPVQKRPPQRPPMQPQKPRSQDHNIAAKKAPSKPAPQISLVKPFIIGVAVLMVVVAAALCYSFLNKEWELLIPENTIEAGTTKPELKMYFKDTPAIERFVSCNLNFDEVNTSLPQTVNFNIGMYGKNFPCRLVIKDTVAPTGDGVLQNTFAGQDAPDPAACVTNVKDVTDVTVTWKEFPDMSDGGKFMAYALLTDASGNETVVAVPFDVTKDTTAPVITGYQDLTGYIGDSITYRGNILIKDDYDESPSLDIDTSAVNINKPGKYDVVYTATDFSGNQTSVKVKIKISKKPAGYVEPDVVYAEAKKILEQITEPGMTEEEVALQIVWWCRYNIRFILRTRSRSWTEAAYNAFTKRTGNCYSTACAVRALLDVAGIENMTIERYPYQTATHFWNYVKINGQWYHCDATWRQNYDSYFFMYTTKELLNFWHDGWNGFQFKQKAFPESATESVQKRIDYKNHKIKAA